MNRYIFANTLLIAILFSGCASQKIDTSDTTIPQPIEQSTLSPLEQALLDIEQSKTKQEKDRSLMRAASLYITENNHRQADTLLQQIDIAALGYVEQEQYLILHLTTAVTLQNENTTAELLKYITPGFASQAPLDVQRRAYTTLSNAYELVSEPAKAATTLIEAAGLFNEDAYWTNHEKIWQLLQKVGAAELSEQIKISTHYDTQGWLSLSLAIHQNQINLDSQYQALLNWLTLWPAHPAAMQLPQELALLKQLPDYRPKRIALALPMSGPLQKAGEAIRDGFIAAFYNDHHGSKPDMEVRVYNSHNRNFPELYQQLLLNTPDLIIGPLEKEHIRALSEIDILPTPILALNYLDEELSFTENRPLYQFGLSVENELNQIAEQLWNKGHRRIMTLIPDNKWGQRAFQDFQKFWQEKSGKLAETAFYSGQDKLSELVESALLVDESKQRYQALRKITGESYEFQPRRREDIDAIVLISTPVLARQLKPLFAFHYASDIPIYSTSHIYTGEVNPQKDHDLNGIRFTETPWSLSLSNSIRTQVKNLKLDTQKTHDRLYALGVDSYRLAPRLPLLQKIKDSQMQGETGLLHLNKSGKIIRVLDWAVFKDGKAQQQAL